MEQMARREVRAAIDELKLRPRLDSEVTSRLSAPCAKLWREGGERARAVLTSHSFDGRVFGSAVELPSFEAAMARTLATGGRAGTVQQEIGRYFPRVSKN